MWKQNLGILFKNNTYLEYAYEMTSINKYASAK